MVEARHDIIAAVSTRRPLCTHVHSRAGAHVLLGLVWLVPTVCFSCIPDHLPLREALPTMPRSFDDHDVL